MCGLILAPNHYSSEGVRRAMDRMKYRGADNERGITQHNGWHLGHVRLAIQDLSAAGSQPFWSDHKVVAFVGEFFNHNGSEKAFLTDILDSPRLVDFHQADGFWSVIEVGYITKVITDHLGIKPMYWWPEKQIVCSEIEPMFELAPRPAFDEVYLLATTTQAVHPMLGFNNYPLELYSISQGEFLAVTLQNTGTGPKFLHPLTLSPSWIRRSKTDLCQIAKWLCYFQAA